MKFTTLVVWIGLISGLNAETANSSDLKSEEDRHRRYGVPVEDDFQVQPPQQFLAFLDNQFHEDWESDYEPARPHQPVQHHEPAPVPVLARPVHQGPPQAQPAAPVQNQPAALQKPKKIQIGPHEYQSPDDGYESAELGGISHEYSFCPSVGGGESRCRPLTECAVWYDDILKVYDADCHLDDGSIGVCCPNLPGNGKPGRPLQVLPKRPTLPYPLSNQDLNLGAEHGLALIQRMNDMERMLRSRNVIVQRNTAAYGHFLFFQANTATVQRGRNGLAVVEGTRELGRRFQLTPEQAGVGLSAYNVAGTVLRDACLPRPVCRPETQQFRTIDGTCNNLRSTGVASAGTPFIRMLPPAYADGVWVPRRARDGSALPSPRLVSISVVPDIDNPSATETLWTMQWGQFIDHDITSTPIFRNAANGSSGIECCTPQGQHLGNDMLHPACLAIQIPNDDPFFAQHRQSCMNFVRSMPAPRLDCSFGHGEQMNQVTHLLDASNIYGSSADDQRMLRSFRDGRLNVTLRNGHTIFRDLLPADPNPEQECRNNGSHDPFRREEIHCFKAGDSRVNQHPTLAVTHTVFLREHNRVAAAFQNLNPHWNDERIYQEARRFVTAEMQHITYNEWLPVVLGRETMQKMGMLPLQYGFSNDYDENINPTLYNEFSTAAFRFGHSLPQGRIHLMNKKRQVESSIQLRRHFFKTLVVYTPGNLDRFLIGLATQPVQNFDNYVSEDLTNHLFEEPGRPFGLDLVSLNIQRGRDHGIPGYNFYREICGLPRARRFEDFADVIAEPIIERFRLLYRHVDDVDLFIGGLSERRVQGAMMGPTFLCINAEQFARTKRGDRFFYDLGGQPHSFTEAQLREIRKTSLSRIVCDNSDVHKMQPLAFRSPSDKNPLVECDDLAIPRPNLAAWQERQPGNGGHGGGSYGNGGY